MTKHEYSKLELAESQLETAIDLFISDQDKFSVITLAGAADAILSQLVTIEGKENYSKISMYGDNSTKPKNIDHKTHGKQINDILCINALKHYDKGESEFVEMDINVCAIGAILKAIVSLKFLGEANRDFVKAFMAWVQLNAPNIDGIEDVIIPTIMDD